MLPHWHATFEKKLGSKVTCVGSLFNLIGIDGERVLRLKAAETWHILSFVVDVCRSHRDQLQEHVDASALLEMRWSRMDVPKREPHKLSQDGHCARIGGPQLSG